MNNDIHILNTITEKIIRCAIEVHKNLGPGLLESIYENALSYEFKLNDIIHKQQYKVPIIYKDMNLGDYRIDLLVENKIIVELKATEKHDPLFEAQLLTYLRVTNKKIGLLINFNTPVLKNGIKRLIH